MAYVELKSYSKILGRKTLLKKVNIKLFEGKIYNIKASDYEESEMLLRAIGGLILPSSGWISVAGQRLDKIKEYPVRLGVIIDELVYLDNCTVLEELEYIARIRGKIDREDIISNMIKMGILSYATTNIKKLTNEQKQCLSIVQAFMETPDIILLNNPGVYLGEYSKSNLRNLINEAKRRGGIVVISEKSGCELDVEYDQIIDLDNNL